MEDNKDINAIVGKNLLKLRKDKKLTQMELAEKFNYSDKSISKWEKGESLPSLDVLCQIAEFYGVSLDDITRAKETNDLTENKTPQEKKLKKEKVKKVKNKTPRMFSTKLMITLLCVGAVWVIATAIYVTLNLTLKLNYFMCFMWAGVASCVVLIVFNAVWGRMRYLFAILSVMLWLILASLHVQIYIHTPENIWPVYFIGIPLQATIILWGALVKKPKGYYKKQKTQDTTEEIVEDNKKDQ